MSPTRPTVLRNVLVPSGTGKIGPVYISPIPAWGKFSDVQVLVRSRVGSEPGRPARGRFVAALPLPEVEAGVGGRAEAAPEQQQRREEMLGQPGHAQRRGPGAAAASCAAGPVPPLPPPRREHLRAGCGA